ncbi:MAG TPA: glycogen/starch synthase, partial [Gammaproteobacteria bacterium]
MSEGQTYRVLFVTSEVQPLMKTGGLADVSASLPAALRARGHDVRILTPAYADTLTRGFDTRRLAGFQPPPEFPKMKLLEMQLPEYGVPAWLIDSPAFSRRSGSPYVDVKGHPYPDNAECFNSLSRVAAWIAAGGAELEWRPDLVHCNEWHTGLIPVWLGLENAPVASVFTIHNLAYQGLFPRAVFD